MTPSGIRIKFFTRWTISNKQQLSPADSQTRVREAKFVNFIRKEKLLHKYILFFPAIAM